MHDNIVNDCFKGMFDMMVLNIIIQAYHYNIFKIFGLGNSVLYGSLIMSADNDTNVTQKHCIEALETFHVIILYSLT